MTFPIGAWVWSDAQQQAGQVIDRQSAWGQTVYRVWFESLNHVVPVAAEHLQPIARAVALTADGIVYRAAAARIAAELAQNVLLAPVDATVIPLPHQMRALSCVMAGDRLRYLLADEVGLGKTIEAGLVMRELKLRGLARRILVVVPKGLVPQWVTEMHTHFNEQFQVVIPATAAALTPEHNIWRQYDQVICPMDSVKPLDGRRGWTDAQLAEHNRQRFGDLITAGWDLIVVDEAHRLGGSSDQVARYQLGLGLADAAPYLLLLSATPHQGKPDAFCRLMALLDADAFPDEASLQRERVRPYVVRTAKRQAIDADGHPLFQPRHTQLFTVAWDNTRLAQRALYEAVSDYVRDGYNKALQEKRNYIGFLLILMQRLVTSSTAAIRVTLQRRLEALLEPQAQIALFDALSQVEWAELDGQTQADTLAWGALGAWRDEQTEVGRLLELADQAAAAGPDPKAEALLEWVYRLQRLSGDPELKMLIFTEFVPTQAMLCEFLQERGFAVVALNGEMGLDQRQAAQTAFAGRARFLVSTDAGGEGLNLQFCHVVVNYDIPWNPMRLEQRIGRADRIGQTHPVQAINLVLADTVEARVQVVLAEKLQIILQQFGVDKTEDVLDSAEAGQLFDDLYLAAILHPEMLADSAERTLQIIRAQAAANREQVGLLTADAPLDPVEAKAALTHPLPRWVEQMTVAYLRAHGGGATAQGRRWHLTWPDGQEMNNVTFAAADRAEDATYLSLENSLVRGLTVAIPPFVAGQPIPVIRLAGLPESVRGVWSLWQLTVSSTGWNQLRIAPLFQSAEGRVFRPTAQRIWELLMAAPVDIMDIWRDERVIMAQQAAYAAIEKVARPIYDELLRAHQERLQRERAKGEYAFAARRRAIERIGLDNVRQHRLALLAREETLWLQEFARRVESAPTVTPLLFLSITGGGA